MAKNFKYIKGSIKENEVATINFFSDVDWWSVYEFVGEFQWLVDYVKPSKIKVLVNSGGGSIIEGMSAFSAIINSPIPTEVIVEGIAASMASVLLAAGNVSKIRDYGLIMMHNPYFYGQEDENDPSILAFKSQLQTIYMTRWGMTKEKVEEIMDGPEGEDGTFMTASQAVEAGIILPENVIVTEPQKKADIEAKLKASNKIDYTKVFAQMIEGDAGAPKNKPSNKDASIINQKENNLTNAKNNMEQSLKTIAASLSMGKEATEDEVMAKVTSLKGVEANLATLKTAHDTLIIEKKGVDASLVTVKNELAETKAESLALKAKVDAFEQDKLDKEAVAKTEFIDAAVTAGKITEEAKADWVALAADNFDVVKKTINGMEGRKMVSDTLKVVDADTSKVKAQKLKGDDKIKEVESKVGADFEFKTMGD